MQSRVTSDPDVGNVANVDSGESNLRLVHIALRITFFIVGPVPVMLVALLVAAAIELITELIAWDTSYYQDHTWCLVLACMVAGSLCFALRRVRYLESGLWIGPLIIGIGIYKIMQ